MSATLVPPVKLLLVDDLDENLLALDALLRRDDLELLKARSGMEALELLLLNDVALALVDVQMPEMDGFELAELMRGSERTSRVPIIFVTAGAREPSRVFQGYDAGAVDFLFKPIDQHILRHKVDTFVELHRQRLQLAVQMDVIRKREDELKRVNQELSATLKLNETFVAAVGHDLRTPLNNVVMSAELMRAQASTPGAMRIVDRLRASADRMSKMIDELFDLARARQGGGIPIMRQPSVDLLPVAERIVGELGGSGRELQLELRGDASGDWDPDRLGQVLSNLVGNAVRHGSPEEPVQVELEGSDPARLDIIVRNRGQIPDDVLGCLFEPFRRGQTRAGSKDGLGLGLFIVEQIVLAHGGTISAESVDTKTTFRVSLPRVAPAASRASASA